MNKPSGRPSVSVCVPTFDRPTLLRVCLESILRQTFTDFELLVLDNASSEDTRDVVLSFSDPRLRYHRNDVNIGPFPNMNLGLELARGDFVCIAHDDDVYLPRFLERSTAFLTADPDLSMVHCAVFEIDEAGRRRRLVRAYPQSTRLDRRAAFRRFLRGHDVCCSSVVAPLEKWRRAGGFDARFRSADFHMWLRLALEGSVGYVAEPLVEMRVHDARGTTSVAPLEWADEFVAIVEEGLAFGQHSDPDLGSQRRSLLRAAAFAQGWRFVIASAAAAARGDGAAARGYVGSLQRLRRLGLPWVYPAAATLLLSDVSRIMLRLVARIRQLMAQRAIRRWNASR